MRRLTLLRHAHAEDRHPSGRDFERRLDAQGLDQAQRAAVRLLGQLPRPSLVLASPAQRTQQTARQVLEAAGPPSVALRLDQRLYNATPVALLTAIHGMDAEVEHLVVVGHNPGISELCYRLLDAAPEGLETAQFASASFAASDWHAIGSAAPREG